MQRDEANRGVPRGEDWSGSDTGLLADFDQGSSAVRPDTQGVRRRRFVPERGIVELPA